MIDHSQSRIATPKRKRRVGKHTRKKRTSERRQMEIQADGLTRTLVLRRDLERCLKCGGDKMLQAAHIFPKGKYPLLRYVLENLLTLCYRDHLEWAHKDPVGFTDWIEAVWPGRIERLRISAGMTRKVDLKELLLVLEAECADGGAPR